MMELAGGQMTGTLGREVISTRQRKIAELAQREPKLRGRREACAWGAGEAAGEVRPSPASGQDADGGFSQPVEVAAGRPATRAQLRDAGVHPLLGTLQEGAMGGQAQDGQGPIQPNLASRLPEGLGHLRSAYPDVREQVVVERLEFASRARPRVPDPHGGERPCHCVMELRCGMGVRDVGRVELSRVPRRDAMPAVRTVPLSNFR